MPHRGEVAVDRDPGAGDLERLHPVAVDAEQRARGHTLEHHRGTDPAAPRLAPAPPPRPLLQPIAPGHVGVHRDPVAQPVAPLEHAGQVERRAVLVPASEALGPGVPRSGGPFPAGREDAAGEHLPEQHRPPRAQDRAAGEDRAVPGGQRHRPAVALRQPHRNLVHHLDAAAPAAGRGRRPAPWRWPRPRAARRPGRGPA